MRNFLKKNFLIFLLVGVILVSLTACSKNKSTAANSAGSKQGKEQTISGTITVFGWGGGEELKVRKEATQIFRKLYPNVKVKEIWLPANEVDKKLDAALAAGNAADVIMMSPDWYGLRTKWFEDLTPYVKKDHLDLQNIYTPGVDVGYVDSDGKREGLPVTASAFVFAYNKDIFDKAGVPYPTDNWTWDDFKTICERVSSGSGINRIYGIVSHWVLPNFATIAYGGKMYNDGWTKQMVDDPNSLKGLQMFGDLFAKKAIPDNAASNTMPMDQMFASGKAAIYPMGLFEAAQIATEIGNHFKWDVVLPPKDPEGKNTNISFLTGFAMNKDSKNKAAAWEYIKTVSTNKEIADLYCKVDIPSLRESAESTFKTMRIGNSQITTEKFVKGLETATMNPWGGALAKAGDQYTQMWQQITIKHRSAIDAAKEYAPRIQSALDELHSQK
ncbi:ABC transporter substrate-binding protein [Caldanaerobius polysaccharolyticus]|uniref:ABC transporter substrate-binding protein n=1 Tax=Caldanaerobius polysaccharolyticus TaxID=44256 RepID=UPI00047CEB2C|nr:sugar ABC transporter substrate-binding protein [Caldanaerobius polysaccharolyticus]